MPEKIWSPSDYDKQSVLQYRTALSMLEGFPFNGNEKILDIGCGSGKISSEISKRVPLGNVLGLDRNSTMIQFASETYASSNLSFVCQDITEMSYRNQFDAVVSFWTLSWIPMHLQVTALTKIAESLTENGRLLLMYPMRHDAYDTVEAVIQKPEWRDYFIEYTPPREFITEERYRSEVIAQIPMDMHVEKKEISCHYVDDQEMRASINCWLSHVDNIPEALKEAFLTDVAESYKVAHGTTEPIMYYSTLEITGIKIAPKLSFVKTASFHFSGSANMEASPSSITKREEAGGVKFEF